MAAYTSSMRAVWLGVPAWFLEERHRNGQDKTDELWEGVLHMVPPPAEIHSAVHTDLAGALLLIARARGWRAYVDCGIYTTDQNYRVPDVIVARPQQRSRRGVDGAELVVEVLSPDDESRDKLPFYAKVGVREVWLVEPATRETEVFTLVNGRYEVVPFAEGRAQSPVLGIELRVADGKLELRDGNDVHVI